jgi:hypothetical protein
MEQRYNQGQDEEYHYLCCTNKFMLLIHWELKLLDLQ